MYPQFMCIGAQKSGTTWLYHNLKDHPQIWLPLIKEIRYFQRRNSRSWLVGYLCSRRGPIILSKVLKHAFRKIKTTQDIAWYLRYLLRKQNDSWYASLFLPEPGQIAGDISPGYGPLKLAIVEHIYKLMPKLKIIYLLRNPIDRSWSHLCMHFNNWDPKVLESSDKKKIKTFINRRRNIRYSQYSKTLQIWEKIYPKEQIFIGFYEQLKEAPSQLLADILNFLEVDASIIPETVGRVIRPSHIRTRYYKPLPFYWAQYLAQRHYSDIQLLHQRFNNASTASWLQSAERYLAL